jgi:integrase
LRYMLTSAPVTKVATVGHWPGLGLAAAKKKASQMRLQASRGEPIGEKANRVTMASFAKRYLAEVAVKRRKDPAPVERWLKRDILPAFGSRQMSSIQGDEVRTLVFRKRDQGSPAAAAAVRNLLKRLFNYAQVCGVSETNPVLRVPLEFVYKAKSRKRALGQGEVTKFLEKIQDVRLGFRHGAMLELLLLTLARKSELRLARWEHIDWKTGVWEVPPENSKGGESHLVYLSRQALSLFRRLVPLDCEIPGNTHSHSGTRRLRPEEFIFPSQNSSTQPTSPSALNQAMKRIKWAMPHFTPHDLRRTASTILNEKGYNRDWIEVALSHASSGIRGVYNRAQYGEERKRMLQEWADWLEGLKDA